MTESAASTYNIEHNIGLTAHLRSGVQGKAKRFLKKANLVFNQLPGKADRKKQKKNLFVVLETRT